MSAPLPGGTSRSQWWAPPDGAGGRRPGSRLARRVAPFVAVGVIGLAALGGSAASLGATSSPVPLKLASTTLASSSQRETTKKGPACMSLKRSDLARLFTVRVGAPYDEGSGACVYGIGPNAKLKGPAIETAESDTFLAQLFPALGPSQYKYYTTALGKTTAFTGPGYKASYVAEAAFGQMEGFDVYVLKGTLFCLVDLNLSSSHEVGLGPFTNSLPVGEALGLAKRVVPLCTDLFSAD